MVRRKKDRELIPRGALSEYTVHFKTANLALCPDEGDCVQRIEGCLLLHSEATDSSPITVGTLDAAIFDPWKGEVFEWADGESQDYSDVASFLESPTWARYRDNLEGLGHGVVLFVNMVWIRPGFRGKSLGVAMVRRLLDTFGRGCGSAVLMPMPVKEVGAPKLTEDEVERYKKGLAVYWGRLGFRPVGRSKFMALDLGLAETPIWEG
jgi:GNAT superfamily N-acetyltransferase